MKLNCHTPCCRQRAALAPLVFKGNFSNSLGTTDGYQCDWRSSILAPRNNVRSCTDYVKANLDRPAVLHMSMARRRIVTGDLGSIFYIDQTSLPFVEVPGFAVCSLVLLTDGFADQS